jgi:DNA-binding transcriptional MocR family regulator
VIEDDHFALLAKSSYFSIIGPRTTRWALVRSVSKGFGPDLRLAFVASDAGTAARLGMRLSSGTTWVSHLLQTVVRGLLAADTVGSHLLAASEVYGLRRETLIGALQAQGLEAQRPCDGFNVWLPLPDGCSATRVAQCLAQRGWCVRTGEAFAITSTVRALRITVSTLAPAEATRFAAQLAHCLGRT